MSRDKTSDADVVKRIRQGDRGAYRILVDRYAPMVFHVLRRYCSSEEDVEDLAQDTFVRAYQNLAEFRGKAQVSSWIYRIAANRGKDFVKSARQKRKHGGGAEAFEHMLQTTDTPHQELEGSERAHTLREAIDTLAPDYATAFMMKYEMGLPYKEMSVLTDTSVSALKVRVHRARKQLRSYLEDKL